MCDVVATTRAGNRSPGHADDRAMQEQELYDDQDEERNRKCRMHPGIHGDEGQCHNICGDESTGSEESMTVSFERREMVANAAGYR
jgi:hypothetical protein